MSSPRMADGSHRSGEDALSHLELPSLVAHALPQLKVMRPMEVLQNLPRLDRSPAEERYVLARKKYCLEADRVRYKLGKFRAGKEEAKHGAKAKRGRKSHRRALEQLGGDNAGPSLLTREKLRPVQFPPLPPGYVTPSEPLVLSKWRPKAGDTRVSLRDAGLTVGDVAILAQVLMHHRVVHLDLSGNDLSSQEEVRMLLRLVQGSASIEEVVLERTNMPPAAAAEIAAMARRNAARRQAAEREVMARSRVERYYEWVEEGIAKVGEVVREEAAQRREVERAEEEEMRVVQGMSRESRRAIVRAKREVEALRRHLQQLAYTEREEATRRHAVLLKSLQSYAVLTVQCEDHLREVIATQWWEGRQTLRVAYMASWRDTRDAERTRKKRELRERTRVMRVEMSRREAVVMECEEETQLLGELHEKHREWVTERELHRAAMVAVEEKARDLVVDAERDERKAIRDKKVYLEQQREAMLSQQRRDFCCEENTARNGILCEYEAVFPTFSEAMKSYRSFVALLRRREALHHARDAAMYYVPVPSLAIKRSRRPPVYVLGEEPVPIGGGLQYTTSLPEKWEGFMRTIEKQEGMCVEEMQVLLARQEATLSEPLDDDMRCTMLRCVEDVREALASLRGPPGSPAALGEWPTISTLSKAKCRIWGGTVVVTVADAPADHHLQTCSPEVGPETLPAIPSTDPRRLLMKSPMYLSWETYNPFGVQKRRDRYWGQVKSAHKALEVLSCPPPADTPPSSAEGDEEGPRVQLTVPLPPDGSMTVEGLNSLLHNALLYHCSLCAMPSKPFMVKATVVVKARYAYTDAPSFLTERSPPKATAETCTSSELHIVVSPPYISGDTRGVTWCEGDEKAAHRPFFPGSHIHNPPGILRDPDTELPYLAQAQSVSSFVEGRLVIRFDVGFTEDDALVFRSTSACWYDPESRQVRCQAGAVGKLTKGVLASASSAESLHQAALSIACEGEREVLELELCEAASAEWVKRTIDQFRFHNVSKDPVVGCRVVHVTLVDQWGSRSSFRFSIEVLAVDDPTELVLKTHNLVYHSPHSGTHSSVISNGATFLSDYPLPVFGDAVLRDPDTEVFMGGSLTVSITPPTFCRYDSLLISNECVHQGPPRPEGLSVVCEEGDGEECEGLQVYWNGLHLGRLVKVYDEPEKRGASRRKSSVNLLNATISSLQDSPDLAGSLRKSRLLSLARLELSGSLDGSPRSLRRGSHRVSDDVRGVGPSAFDASCDGKYCRELRLTITDAGTASMTSVQQFLRSVQFTNYSCTPPTATTRLVAVHFAPGASAPKVDVAGNVRRLIPPAEPQEIDDTVAVKVTSSLITVQPKFARMKYVEGSGAQRLTSFEVLGEAQCDQYDGGSVRVEFMEGFEAGCDQLQLRGTDGLHTEGRELFDTEAEYLAKKARRGTFTDQEADTDSSLATTTRMLTRSQ